MLNTIKMDLYRMFKSKSMYVMLVIGWILVLVSLGTLRYQLDHPEVREMIDQAVDQTGEYSVGIQAGYLDAHVEKSDMTMNIIAKSVMSGGSYILLAMIFAVIFSCSEHNSGFIKNVVSKKGYRMQFSISKTITMAVFLLCQMVTTLILMTIASKIVIGTWRFDSFGDFILYILVNYLIYLFLIVIGITIVNLSRSIALSMALGICICSGIFSLVASLIDRLNLPIVISEYLPSYGMKTLPISFSAGPELYQRMLVMTSVGIVIFGFLNSFIMKRQDIK